MNEKVYIAGPWVFRPDAKEHAEYLRALAKGHGFTPLIPIDNECSTASQIKVANETMIEQCDCIIADLTPFRGPSADVGTAFELGYAWAMNKLVVMWSADQRNYEERVKPDGMTVESFGLKDNLMLTGWMTNVHSSINEAFQEARKWFGHTY